MGLAPECSGQCFSWFYFFVHLCTQVGWNAYLSRYLMGDRIQYCDEISCLQRLFLALTKLWTVSIVVEVDPGLCCYNCLPCYTRDVNRALLAPFVC